MKADSAAIGPEAIPEGASASSDRRAQSDFRSGACEAEATTAASGDRTWLAKGGDLIQGLAALMRSTPLSFAGVGLQRIHEPPTLTPVDDVLRQGGE